MSVMSAINFDTIPGATADGPRKRRKRAPAAGAANDCFTCQSRNVECSRGRPYCAQCLDAGHDCAGYKTQLTWGVGVASRGKLRGLSLPVAGTKKTAESASPPKPKKRHGSNVASSQPPPSSSVSPEATRREASSNTQAQPLPVSHAGGYENGPVYQRLQHTGRGSISFAPVPGNSSLQGSGQFPPPSQVNVGWTNVNVFQPPMYTPPPQSPSSYSASTSNGQYANSETSANYSGYQPTSSPYPVTPSLSAIMNPVFPSTITYPAYTSPRPKDYERNKAYLTSVSTIATPTLLDNGPAIPEEDVEEIKREADREVSVSDSWSVKSAPLMFDTSLSISPFSGATSVGKTPRMQYLIQYYAEVIAPVIVAFDSATNPFREQVLMLAAKSESLQHAIAALAASNMRQRRETGTLSTGKTLPARRSSAAHLSLTNEAWYDAPILPLREQKREEIYHKYHAVQHLNQALASQQLRKEDSVLATLLLLCLFHICDSGIARFQTQFAGVRMLLTLRQNELGGEDHNTKWMTRLFTLYDGLAATVNEREGQFKSHHLDQSAISDSEWSYEMLSGIDSNLFRRMSKLGRLNILSQGKRVEDNPTLVSCPMPMMGPNIASFDAKAWMRIVDDENMFMSRTANPDVLEQFWREWRQVRHELQMWDIATKPYDSSHPDGPRLTDDQRIDVGNISNAFRYSALLYTERLGNPQLTSSDEKIQYWVRHALHYIKHVRSDVYLLWPLFITGSECVHEEGRNIIRERCLDIQKDSGFVNNASCLALLEKVWKVVPVVGVSLAGSPNQEHTMALVRQGLLDGGVNGFRFRDVMLAEGNEGEWIVV